MADTIHARPHGEAPGLVRRQKEEGETRARDFIVVFPGRSGSGRGSRLRRRRTGLFE